MEGKTDVAFESLDPSPPSETWLFAQAILGRPLPSLAANRADAQVKRDQLEWLASISVRHAEELRRQQSAEAEARRRRAQLEWLASISTEHESQLRSLLSRERETREAQARYEQLAEAYDVREAQWDPAKHPRLGGPPNAGWFANTGGTASSGKARTAGRAHVPGTDATR
jgi:hypothetical protein